MKRGGGFYFIVGIVFVLLAILMLHDVSATMRDEVDEWQTASVSCSNPGEVITSVEAYYYCSNNVQVGIYCESPGDHLGKQSTSFTFTNSNCGFDPCVYVAKKGILLIECGPAGETPSEGSQLSNTNTQIASTQTPQENDQGFFGFMKSLLSGIASGLRKGFSQQEQSSQDSALAPHLQTEEEKVIDAVLNNDLTAIKAASKPLSLFAIDQYALQNEDISVCDDGTPECVQKTLFFSCAEAEDKDWCEFEIINDMRRVSELNFVQGENHFENNAKINVVYQALSGKDVKLKRFKFNGGGQAERCEIVVRLDSDSGSYYNYYEYNRGAIVPSRDSSLNDPSRNVRSVKSVNTVSEMSKEFPWSMKKDCNSRNCAILDEDVIAPKGDLLCGYDDRWYLCEGFGIQNFNNGEQYFCDNGRWERIKQYSEVMG
ncbi:MAG: hypothetical protein KKB79_01415 [Nanoarchaeota archaeon]|nr:hypothetical protein [Nanoarchaeota archaeon]